ncbi:MAG: hypothetical protein METHP_01101 [Methanoregula sp. SKADARSKE-2]|nr:MAG: hypothetical protein METHP_01101 [Methanoregula sp. SKADARSKE-2]
MNVVKIGGHGAIDYGRKVMFPLCEEIGKLAKKHQILVVTGGGGRVRHIMDIGMDLGMPTGVLAELSAKISEQNAWQGPIVMNTLGRTPPGFPRVTGGSFIKEKGGVNDVKNLSFLS